MVFHFSGVDPCGISETVGVDYLRLIRKETGQLGGNTDYVSSGFQDGKRTELCQKWPN